jgi:hypothetical protein
LWTIVGLALSITPTVRIGDAVVRLPHADLVERFPGLDMLRDPIEWASRPVRARDPRGRLVRRGDATAPQRLASHARLAPPAAAAALVVLASAIVWAPIALRVAPWPDAYPIGRRDAAVVADHGRAAQAGRRRAAGAERSRWPVRAAARADRASPSSSRSATGARC